MNHRFTRLAVCCLAACAWSGCETASQVADRGESQTPAAPAIQQVSAEGPGSQDAVVSSEFTTTDSGLKYRILRAGTGAKPTSADTVEVHYKGTLDDGTVFDSSYDRGQSISFPLLGVIKGWTEGLQYVREGGKIELEIPGDLGYGQRGSPPKIPANATLHFIVELIEVQ